MTKTEFSEILKGLNVKESKVFTVTPPYERFGLHIVVGLPWENRIIQSVQRRNMSFTERDAKAANLVVKYQRWLDEWKAKNINKAVNDGN